MIEILPTHYFLKNRRMSEMIMFNKKSFTMIGKMAQQIKVLTIKPEKQSSTPQTHVVKGQNRLPQVVP